MRHDARRGDTINHVGDTIFRLMHFGFVANYAMHFGFVAN